MSDADVPDCPFHRLLTAWEAADKARTNWKHAKAAVDELHPLDPQFGSADKRSLLSGYKATYEESLVALSVAFDATIPNGEES